MGQPGMTPNKNTKNAVKREQRCRSYQKWKWFDEPLPGKSWGKVIDEVDVFWPRIIKYPHEQEQFKMELAGQPITELKRKGKYLIIGIGDKAELVVHFRMTGKFKRLTPDARFDKHIHLFIHFQDDPEGLAYHDVRKFAICFSAQGRLSSH